MSECLIDLSMYIFAFDPEECQHLTSKERKVNAELATLLEGAGCARII